jgi:hypothetical protein
MPFTDEMQEARTRVSAVKDPSQWPFSGIQGPRIEGRDEWRDDHSLISFRHFWDAATKRRGISAPEVVERYPYLAGDARDAGVVFRYLRGELQGFILEMTYTNAAALYEASEPTWVAAPLAEWRRP